jgi:hypothetical protein
MQHIVRINKLDDFKNLKEVIDLIKAPSVLILDGPMQSGKTSLVSQNIAKFFKIPVIHIDNHVVKNDYYLHDINIIDFSKEVKNELENNKNILIEGILIKKYIETINISDVLWIYVKVVNNGRWVGCDEYDIDRIIEYGIDTSLSESNPLHNQILNYHKEYYPHTSADLIIELDQDFLLNFENKN